MINEGFFVIFSRRSPIAHRRADIEGARLGPDQADPVSPDVAWPEAPSTWVPPSRKR